MKILPYNYLRERFKDINELRFKRAYIAYRYYNKPITRSIQRRFFFDDEFNITHTLDPRPETEQLVELVIDNVRKAHSILDICTGSGCILLSLLKKYRSAQGIGTDISIKALETAKLNSKSLNIGRRAKFICTDLATNISHNNKFDIIISNPPYIEKIINHELLYDPEIALIGNLNIYKTIIEQIYQYLHDGSKIFFEINEKYGKQICDFLSQYNIKSRIIKDYAQRDRFIIGEPSFCHLRRE